MKRRSLRCLPRKSYSELEEPSLDEYVFCEKCADFVYEYCSIHGPLLVIPDDKVPAKTGFPDFVPRAALTIPRVFLHIAPSVIPGAGLGVFSTLTLPPGVRFGPYRGRKTKDIESSFCWQIRDSNNKWSHAIDASDPSTSNWMRYVNCARQWPEQNLVAYQYQGQIYYRTIKIIPRFTELLVFYGSEFAVTLRVDLRLYNSPSGYAQKFGAPLPQKTKLGKNTKPFEKLEDGSSLGRNKAEVPVTKNDVETKSNNAMVKYNDNNNKHIHIEKKSETKKKHDKNNSKTPNKKPTNPSLITNQLICDRCGLIFKCNDTLQSHFKKHESFIEGITFKPNSRTRDICYTYKENEKSDLCNTKSFDQQNNIKCQLGSDKPYTCDYCKKPFSRKKYLIKHVMIHTNNRPYKCDTCDKAFTDRSSLNVHLRLHTGIKPYKCDTCDKAFTHKHHLKGHLRLHTGIKPYKCDTCGKAFTDRSSLNVHLRLHTGIKPYKCDTCGKAFTQKSSLNTHLRLHTGIKPYKCDTCGKAFTDRSSLNVHLRLHTGIKPYKCDTCDKAFTQKHHLKGHLRLHTGIKPYKCDTCDKAFTDRSSLNVNLRLNTGIKPYKCDTCDKAFTQKHHLKGHLRLHTGIKPYKCDTCDKAFTHKVNLNSHLRLHTGIKP